MPVRSGKERPAENVFWDLGTVQGKFRNLLSSLVRDLFWKSRKPNASHRLPSSGHGFRPLCFIIAEPRKRLVVFFCQYYNTHSRYVNTCVARVYAGVFLDAVDGNPRESIEKSKKYSVIFSSVLPSD